MADRKVFAGGKIRRFRRRLHLTQTQMAQELELSASYLNLIERDERPVSARVLLKLAQTYDFDLRTLADDDDAALTATLQRAASDPALEPVGLDAQDVQLLMERHPRAAEAVSRLYQLYREAAQRAASEAAAPPAGTAGALHCALADALSRAGPYAGVLEDAAAGLFQRRGLEVDLVANLAGVMEARHRVTTVILPETVMGRSLHRFDRHNRRLQLSERLALASRAFAIAYHIALMGADEVLSSWADAFEPGDQALGDLLRIQAAKYVAAAMLAPYEPFYDAARTLRWDVDALAGRFGLSFTQAARRLTSLRRPGATAPGFVMLRADPAGAILDAAGVSSADALKALGPCGRWIVFDGANHPDRDRLQWVETPDHVSWLCASRLSPRTGARAGSPGGYVTLALMCPAAEASDWAASDGLAAPDHAPPSPGWETLGPGCGRCERPDCDERAAPPAYRGAFVDPGHRSASPFPFRVD